MNNFIIILLIQQYTKNVPGNYSKLQKIMKPCYLKGVSCDKSKVKFVKSFKKKDGQQFHQYQQNDQSPLIS